MPSWLSLPAPASWPESELSPKLSVQVKAKHRALPVAESTSVLSCSGWARRERFTAAAPFFPPFPFPKVSMYIHGRCTERGQLLHNWPEPGIHV